MPELSEHEKAMKEKGYCLPLDNCDCYKGSNDKKEHDKVDMVNHPPHYKQHPSGVECIDITEHFNFNIGNAIKYLWRSEHKNGLEDLKKAEWYIKREIQKRENNGKSS